MVSKVTYKINIRDLIGSSNSEVTEAVGELLVEKIKDYCSSANSPVDGYDWNKRLSPKYKKLKEAATGRKAADMDLTGEMLEALTYRATRDTVEVGIFDKSQVGKADGHNNFSGDSQLPLRRFIPNNEDEDKFKAPIMRELIALAEEILQDKQQSTED